MGVLLESTPFSENFKLISSDLEIKLALHRSLIDKLNPVVLGTI